MVFLTSKSSRPLIAKAARAGNVGGGSALGACMVSASAFKTPALLDFDTSVFKKEKINLPGHDEVSHLLSPLLFLVFMWLDFWKKVMGLFDSSGLRIWEMG